MPILWMAVIARALSATGVVNLIDLGGAALGGLIIGASLGVWLLPAVVDRLHRGK